MRRIPAYVLLLLSYLLLAGCGGGGSSSQPNGPGPQFFSGLYSISDTSNTSAASNFTVSGSLIQSGSSVSGVMHINMPSCFSFNSDVPVSGTLGGDLSVDLLLSLPNGQKLSFTMTHPGGHLTFVGGSYALTGAGCAAVDQGAANGNIVSAGGNWTGNLVSSTGTVSKITLSLTQTGPDAHGFFSATGTATITGGTCFASATVDPSTLITGPGSTVVLDNSAPGTTGKTIITGDFVPGLIGELFNNGTYTSTQGACSESGTANLLFL
jgi:hypothetical protein